MLEPAQIMDVKREVEGWSRPVLSLYADINPSRENTRPHAVMTRLKNSLGELTGLPDGTKQRVLRWFEERLPQGRGLALFADQGQLRIFHFMVEIVGDGGRDHVDARLGEPYFTPLIAAMRRHRTTLIALAGRDSLHVLRTFMGEVEPLFEAEREPVAEEQDSLGQSKNRFPQGVRSADPSQARSPQTAGNQQNHPKYVADRGDAAIQLAHEHIDESQMRFYQEQGKRLEQIMLDGDVEQIVLMGPERDTQRLRASLPSEVKRRVGATLPDLPEADPSPASVLSAVQDSLQDMEKARVDALLDTLTEAGATGAQQCLQELQQGRLHVLMVPRMLEDEAFVNETHDYVALTQEQAKAPDGADRIAKVSLGQKLPDLAERWGARLEFAEGECARRLVQDLGGMAGLRRW